MAPDWTIWGHHYLSTLSGHHCAYWTKRGICLVPELREHTSQWKGRVLKMNPVDRTTGRLEFWENRLAGWLLRPTAQAEHGVREVRQWWLKVKKGLISSEQHHAQRDDPAGTEDHCGVVMSWTPVIWLTAVWQGCICLRVCCTCKDALYLPIISPRASV